MTSPILTIQRGLFVLVRRWTVVLPNGKWVDIPAGFATNFASIPWFVRWLISPIDSSLLHAAIIHDYLVGEFNGEPGVLHSSAGIERVSWRQAAAILRSVMDADGARTWKRQAVYLAVRLHGVFM